MVDGAADFLHGMDLFPDLPFRQGSAGDPAGAPGKAKPDATST
jgi:hypothetical protein